MKNNRIIIFDTTDGERCSGALMNLREKLELVVLFRSHRFAPIV